MNRAKAFAAVLAKVSTTALVLVWAAPLTAAQIPRIAIIIDDLGYQLVAGRRAIALPGPVACAILPDAPRARTLADEADASGKEVLLHLPMQAVEQPERVEASQMNLEMSRKRFTATFATALRAVPHAIGINNHQGSLLTRHPGHMRWLMDELLDRGGLFFVDSYTTADSVAMQVAREVGVSATKRDVFLDADPSREALVAEFARLQALATRHGSAIAIGHPYDATLAFLEQELPRLAERGFDLVAVSELVAN